ncbi:MAG: hypothetical protein Q8K65_03980 [Alphaproteobacteria bacterium]|nr:hypothetical protein [Alphaproteobacteria bacterium]
MKTVNATLSSRRVIRLSGRLFAVLGLAAALCLPLPAAAQKAPTAQAPVPAAGVPQNELRHPELEKFKTDGGEVEFIGHAYGLDGWLLTRKDMPPRTAYTTAEGGLVLGQLVNRDGAVETMSQLHALKAKMEGSQDALPGAEEPKSTASKSERFYAMLERRAAWVQAGKEDAPYLYMMMNVNCDHCKEYWKALEPSVKEGKLQVRLVPFGAQPANRDGGAALLSSADPGVAWSEYIGGNTEALGTSKIVDGALAAIAANSKMLSEFNVPQAPFTIYRRPDDGKLTVIQGKPGNMLLLQAELAKN